MAPNLKDIEQQTSQIIICLFEEKSKCSCCIETDGPENHDRFDPHAIAGKLRALGDDYDENVIQPLMNSLRQAAEDQAAVVFGEGVDSLCRSHVAQRPEVAPEMQLIRASVTLVLYAGKTSPSLRDKAQAAMATFLNSRVVSWVAEQGGWAAVTRT